MSYLRQRTLICIRICVASTKCVADEETKNQKADLRYLHLQSSETGPSRCWYLEQIDEHHEFVRERYLRTNCWRSVKTGASQQEKDHFVSRSADFRSSSVTRRTREACRERRNQSCDEIHQLEVGARCLFGKSTAFFKATHFNETYILKASHV